MTIPGDPPPVPPAPEFLPIGSAEFVRVSSVNSVGVDEGENADGIILSASLMCDGADADSVSVFAPYFGAWLDRLGIPWTEELRKAHAAATHALCHDAPGGGLLCARLRGHEGPHGCRLDGVDRDWLPPMHPDARAEGGAA